MSSETVNASLAQIAESGIPITWYEALAIVQQICRTLLDQPGEPSLDRAGIFIQSSGDVTIQSSSAAGGEAVHWLGELLRSWLADSPYPVPLRLVVAQATCTPPFYTSTVELFEALSHYERPNRQELIRDVYEHWRSAASVPGESAPSSSDALPNAGERWKSMREREIHAEPEAAPAETLETVQVEAVQSEAVTEEPRRPFLPEWWDWHVALTAAALTILLVGTSWLVASARGRTTVRTAVAKFHRTDDRVADTLSPVFGQALDWLGTHPATRIAAPFKPAIVPPAPAPVEARPRILIRDSERAAPSTSVAPIAQPASDPSLSQAPVAVPAPPPAPELPRVEAPPAAETVVVYSAADADVVPPGPIGQRLLDSPPPAAQQQRFTALTIVVDENGHVESATLARKPATLQDAMLATANLSAAKNWRFLPAVRGGQPVKYRRTVWVANR
jgi:hypothetical protein